jgi:hypothetical protein
MPVAKKEDAMPLLACLLLFGMIPLLTHLFRRGYDPMGWGIHLSVLGMGAAIIDSAWVRAWMSTLEPEASLTPDLNPMSLPWGDIGMVLLMLSMLCFALWIVPILFHKEEPPMEDK